MPRGIKGSGPPKAPKGGRKAAKGLMPPLDAGIAGAAGAVSAPMINTLAVEQPPALSISELPVVPSPGIKRRGAHLSAPGAREKALATRRRNAEAKKKVIADALAAAGLGKKVRKTPAMRMADKMAKYQAEGKRFTAGMKREFIAAGGNVEELKQPRKPRERKAGGASKAYKNNILAGLSSKPAREVLHALRKANKDKVLADLKDDIEEAKDLYRRTRSMPIRLFSAKEEVRDDEYSESDDEMYGEF